MYDGARGWGRIWRRKLRFAHLESMVRVGDMLSFEVACGDASALGLVSIPLLLSRAVGEQGKAEGVTAISTLALELDDDSGLLCTLGIGDEVQGQPAPADDGAGVCIVVLQVVAKHSARKVVAQVAPCAGQRLSSGALAVAVLDPLVHATDPGHLQVKLRPRELVSGSIASLRPQQLPPSPLRLSARALL